MSAAHVKLYYCSGCDERSSCPMIVSELHFIWLGDYDSSTEECQLCDSCMNVCRSVYLDISPEKRYDEDKEYFFKRGDRYYPIEISPSKRKEIYKDLEKIIKDFNNYDYEIVHSSEVPPEQLMNEFRRMNFID